MAALLLTGRPPLIADGAVHRRCHLPFRRITTSWKPTPWIDSNVLLHSACDVEWSSMLLQ